MSNDSQDDDAGRTADGGVGAAQENQDRVADVERRLARLAEEVGTVLESAPAEDREALHDYAVSLVRDRLPVAEAAYGGGGGHADRSPERSRSARGANAATLVGYGVLLLPVGFVLTLVFPAGLMLVLGGFVMIGMGVVTALVSWLFPSKTSTRA